jgi:hypothetical protein
MHAVVRVLLTLVLLVAAGLLSYATISILHGRETPASAPTW